MGRRCIRWQHDGLPVARDSRAILAQDAVSLLDVPVHKTGTAFTKPIDQSWARPSRHGRRCGLTAEAVGFDALV